jgi:hypothetical protein
MKSALTVILLSISTFLSCKDPKEEIFQNFKEHEKEIYLVRGHFIGMMPQDLFLYIRFESDDLINFKLDQRNYDDKTSWNKSKIFDQYGQFHRFGIDKNSAELRVALKLINLTVSDLDKLKWHLDHVNCNSIGNYPAIPSVPESEYVAIGFPTGDLYGLEYDIFWHNLDDKDMREIVKACDYKKINDMVVVKYTGPAFGSDCFPDKKGN